MLSPFILLALVREALSADIFLVEDGYGDTEEVSSHDIITEDNDITADLSVSCLNIIRLGAVASHPLGRHMLLGESLDNSCYAH